MIPTRRFAALVAVVAPVWLLSSTRTGFMVAISASVVLLVLAIIDAIAQPNAARLRVLRSLPGSIGLGDSARGRYEVQSSWPLRLHAELHDALVPAVERTSPPLSETVPWRIGALDIPRGGAGELNVELVGRVRGEHALGRVVLRVRGPLGLTQRSLKYTPGGVISVVPSISGIRRYRLLAVQHRLRDLGVRTIRRRGEGASFANLREYVSGDDPRHIDWKSSARRSKLITREYAVEQGQTVLIAIDAGRLMTQLAGTISRFEHALTSATILADVAVRSGDQVGLIVFDHEVRVFVPPAKGGLALRRIREALVPLNATLTEPDYAGAFRTLATRHRKRSLLVIFTDVVDPRASRALIAHSARSVARHLPLVVALQNDELVSAAIPHGEEANDRVFEHAAAEELLLEREEALARMKRAGVSVLDVSPRIMTAAVVNRYLALKARSAL